MIAKPGSNDAASASRRRAAGRATADESTVAADTAPGRARRGAAAPADAMPASPHAGGGVGPSLVISARIGGHRPVLRLRKVPHLRPSLFLRRLVAGQPLIPPAGNRSPAYRAAKRAIGCHRRLAAVGVPSPLLLLTLAVLLVTTRGKPIFRQVRLGRCGHPFRMYKFRTMTLDAEHRQRHVENHHQGPIFKNRADPRVTALGYILRVSSIDELPQLVNVLLGQMSLVGPRPPVPREVAQYAAWQRRRLAVKPGLTCLWQVSGRSEIGFEDWVRMDLWYVRHQGLWTDLKLLARTPWSVLSQRGAY